MKTENHSIEHKRHLLVVDDEKVALRNLCYALEKDGYAVTPCQSGECALKALEQESFDVVLTDLRMEKIDGMEVLRKAKALHPIIEVIVITGHATVSSAVDAMKEGAFHYIAKPFRLEEARHVVREALQMVQLRRENAQLRELLDTQHSGIRIVSQHLAMQKLLETARQVAPTDCNIFITGESGTGKELLARYVHSHSKRHNGPFIAINCGAFTEELLANELFGHAKGAFTGANQEHVGLIASAAGGTLFLDESTEMSPSMQAKLLRVIQEREFFPVGSSRAQSVDVRFLAASNRDLREIVTTGHFRNDLYYRLNVVNLHILPLRERRDDIPLLAYHFLKKYSAVMGKPVTELAPEVIAALQNHDYPGNVRELENIIERGVALAIDQVLRLEQLPADVHQQSPAAATGGRTHLPSLETQEADYIKWVLEQTKGNRSQAAQILGIDRVSLWRKLKKYQLDDQAEESGA